MNKRQTTIITALTVAAAILGLMTSGRYWFRLDLTKNKAYTISEVSRNLYREIPDPVNITYFLSDKLKTIVPAPGEIEDTLREYAEYSRGKIILTVRDPVKADLSALAEELGLQPRQIQTVEQDQASFTTVYSGIVIEYLDKIEVLPWIISTETLEYDLTTRIRSMIRDTERSLGVIVGDSFRYWSEDFQYLNIFLQSAGFKIRLMYPGDEISDNLPALFVLGGVEDLDDWALYRIDRYIQLGGKALFAVNGIYVDVKGTLEARRQEDLGLLDMIASYGVTVRPELALDRSALEMVYTSMTPSGGTQYRIVRYPLWIAVTYDNGNTQHPVSTGFAGLDLFWASPLELHPLPLVEAVPLFTSSPEAWSMRQAFYTSPEILYMLEAEAPETRGTKILGASLSGLFPSFYRDAPKPVREGSEAELPDMPAQASPSRIIVIGDTDFATNIIDATQAIQNMDFLLRIADWLVNDDDVIGIRSREPQAGRFDKILDPSRRAAAMRFSQILNVALVPLFVIAAGFYLASRRRKRSRYAEKNTAAVKEGSGEL
ncbi:MAG: GldG family protein [Treponema sp.]|jgi:ABC-type uncharacterized transport system involved in gliding motility auxiliary subunit|nr:GldG family protein [Treponema sp.]